MGWPGCHVIAKLIFVAFNKHAEIPANQTSPANWASPAHVIRPSEKGWRFDVLCVRSPGVKGIYADALLCDSLCCQSLRFVVEARYSTEPIQ